MQRHLLALIITLCLSLNALQARITYPHQWQQLPSQQLLDKAESYSQADHLDSAMVCYSIVASRQGKDKSTDQANCLSAIYNMGELYLFYYYNYQKAADCLLQAQEMALASNDSVHLSRIYNDLGCLYVQYEESDHSKSMDYYKQSCRYATPHSNDMERCMFNLVYLAVKYGYYAKVSGEANEYCNNPTASTAITHLCAAANAAELKDYNLAISHVDQALALTDENASTSMARRKGCLLMLRCMILDKAGRDQESIDELKRYEQLVRAHGFKEGIPDIYYQYYQFYSARGNVQLAEKNQLKYFLLVDSLNNSTQLAYLNKASFVFDLQKATEEIRIQEIQRERLTQILWIVTIAAIIFMALMLMLWRRNKQLRERNQALYDQSLQQLAIIDEARKNAPPVQAPMPVEEAKPETDNESSETKVELEPSSDVVDPALEEVFQRVKAVMESSPEIYEEDFSLSKLHVLIGGNIKNISRAIGTYAHCDLKALLSQYRIREACRRMNDVEHYGNYTIEAIAKSVGVTSRTSFVQNFKRQTGLTPSAYLKLARNKQA